MNRIISLILAILICLPSPALAFKIHYYDSDATGTPIAIEDEDGNQEWKGEYYPFGEERGAGSAKINNRRLIGKQKDVETGLTYFEARYMFAGSGRFLTPDPVGAVDEFSSATNHVVLVQPQRLNRYAYGLNNPYRYVDPDGEFPFLVAALAGAAIAYMTAPDIANAPESSSTPTYESHGARNIAVGAAGGLGVRAVGSAVSAYKLAQGASNKGTALPDSAWHKNAPHQVTPGTRSTTHQKYNPKTKRLETSRVEYDQYGRQAKRTDHTDHGYGDISKPKEYHSNPHTHTYEYGPGYGPKGKETRINQ